MPEPVDSLYQPLPAFKQSTRDSFRASFSSISLGGVDFNDLEKILDEAEDVLDTLPLPTPSSSTATLEPRPIEQVAFTPSNTMQWNPPDADTANEFIKMFSFGSTAATSNNDFIKPSTTLSSLTNLSRKVSSSSLDSSNNSSTTSSFKTEQWSGRFRELIRFKEEFGHCLVPHNWPQNKKLAQWVKRQRYQHRLLEQGRHSTLTADRVAQLEDVGFVWNSHKAGWDDKFQQLKDFALKYKHCNVPSSWSENPSLAVWVKFQRRQYKLKVTGKSSSTSNAADKNNTLTDDRIQKLLSIGFSFDPRNTMA